jgi:hypothetical protein
MKLNSFHSRGRAGFMLVEKVPTNTRAALSDVANTSFWSPYP